MAASTSRREYQSRTRASSDSVYRPQYPPRPNSDSGSQRTTQSGSRMGNRLCGRGQVDQHDLERWQPSIPKEPANCSVATLENARYRLDGISTADHTNEDRHFVLDGGKFLAFGVFDGHDGPRAAGFASHYLMEQFSTKSWKSVVERGGENIPLVLKEFFSATEKDFFKSIKAGIDEKVSLQAIIPKDMKSYQAYQLYPLEVARLQELEPKISGGCTAVVTVVYNKKLYVANIGDSRAVLVREKIDGTLVAEQLSVDHGVQNEEELKRLEGVGLKREGLVKAGRLGSQENTRSIGDYYIKDGYKDVDTLRHATGPPGIAEPDIISKEIEDNVRYLILMTDGVYKSIEAVFQDANQIEGNKVLLAMLNHASHGETMPFSTVSDRVLQRLQQIHHDTYQSSARVDERSETAVTCRKRDDMTLLVYKFPVESSVDFQGPPASM